MGRLYICTGWYTHSAPGKCDFRDDSVEYFFFFLLFLAAILHTHTFLMHKYVSSHYICTDMRVYYIQEHWWLKCTAMMTAWTIENMLMATFHCGLTTYTTNHNTRQTHCTVHTTMEGLNLHVPVYVPAHVGRRSNIKTAGQQSYLFLGIWFNKQKEWR